MGKQHQQPSILRALLVLSTLVLQPVLADDGNERIIGGVPVEAGTYPYYCVSSDPSFCGCSLIAGDILLTAAHCAAAFQPGQTVYLGGIQLDGSDATATVTIQEQFIHPSWSPSTLEHDFLTLKIEEDMSSIAPPTWNAASNVPADGTTCTVMGFGLTEDFEVSPDLLHVQLNIVNQDTCDDRWGFGYVRDSMICAGSEYGRSACNGDSGSPLVCDGVIVGITSWGSSFCPEDLPSVFARVSEADIFIKEGICKMTALGEPTFCAEFTSSPTTSPTELPPPPANDDCGNAITLSGSTASGSTLGATFDDVGFCGTINSGPGVWYTIEGDGSFFRVDTCADTSFDTRLSVFEGGCGSMTCITGNDQSNSVSCSPNGSVVAWQTQVGVTYHVLVHGTFSFAGSFTLNVESFVPPENDLCANAITVDVGSSVSGTTELATTDTDLSALTATCPYTIRSPGVWYNVMGSGSKLRASTCEGTPNTFDTVLQVYSSCAQDSCVASNDQSCGSLSSVDFDTVEGDEYYILVNGYFLDEVGPFQLTIEEATQSTDGGDGSSPFNPFGIISGFLCFLRSLIDIFLPGNWSCAR